MTLVAIALPDLGVYRGSEQLMDAQGFTLDGRGLVVRVAYLVGGEVRHASWLYDLSAGRYTLGINSAISLKLGQVQGDVTSVEVHDVQAYAAGGKQGLAVLYSVPGQSGRQIATLVDGVVQDTDVLELALPDADGLVITRFAISDDGRFVALQTTSAALSTVAEALRGVADENDDHDVYLLDRPTHQIKRVSALSDSALLEASLLADIAVRGGQVQVSFVSNAAFVTADQNALTTDPAGAGDAYLWSQAFSASGLTGSPVISLISSVSGSAIGGVDLDSQAPEQAGPLLTAGGIYFNSTSAQLDAADTNLSADAFLLVGGVTSRLAWDNQPALDRGGTVVTTSASGMVAGVLTASSAIAGSYNATRLLVTDVRNGDTLLLPTANASGSVLSASLSPDGSRVAFATTLDGEQPLVSGGPVLGQGVLYVADTGFSSPLGYTLQGTITHWKTGQALAAVTLSEAGQEASFQSGGRFVISQVTDQDSPDDGWVQLSPVKAAPARASASITLTDVLAALKVYLNKPLAADINGYTKYVAADFDGNGTVNLTDVLTLLKYYLNKPTTVTPQWVFLETGSGGVAPLNEKGAAFGKDNGAALPAPIAKDLGSLSGDIQIVGILRGDVDGSSLGT